jgi:hypothetical protein
MSTSWGSIPGLSPNTFDELPPKHDLPWVWFGFVFVLAAFAEEFLSGFLGLETTVSTIAFFVIVLAGWIYWLSCVSRFHTILREVSRNQYPITNVEAVGKHFIPFFNFYWIFKWPSEMSNYINGRRRVKLVSGGVLGALLLVSMLVIRFFDAGIGLACIFGVGLYINSRLRAHLKSISPGDLPPAPNPEWFAPPTPPATQAGPDASQPTA